MDPLSRFNQAGLSTVFTLISAACLAYQTPNLVSPSWATPLAERVISKGEYAGRKLIDVVKSYSTPSPEGARVYIPKNAIDDAFAFFDQHQDTKRNFRYVALEQVKKTKYREFKHYTREATGQPTIGNKDFMAIFDLNQSRNVARLHIINLNTGKINSMEASHGRGSECDNKEFFACKFISDRESTATPLGFFSTGQSYYTVEHPGESMTMNGLEKGSANRIPGGNDVPSTIIIHSADEYVKKGSAGRSLGCVSISLSNLNNFAKNLAKGALFYFYHRSLDKTDTPEVSGLVN